MLRIIGAPGPERGSGGKGKGLQVEQTRHHSKRGEGGYTWLQTLYINGASTRRAKDIPCREVPGGGRPGRDRATGTKGTRNTFKGGGGGGGGLEKRSEKNSGGTPLV